VEVRKNVCEWRRVIGCNSLMRIGDVERISEFSELLASKNVLDQENRILLTAMGTMKRQQLGNEAGVRETGVAYATAR